MATVARTDETFATANGVSLCWQAFGEESAEPLVLIMGLGAQMVMWEDPFCEQLAARGFRVIRFDNRDIGRSQKMTGGERVTFADLIGLSLAGKPIPAVYTLKDMAADTVGLLDALGIARAHIVGLSMGGAIAQEIALGWPDRVKTLTSIMASPGGAGLPPPTPEAAAVLMTPPPATKEEYVATFQRTWKVLRAGSFPQDEATDADRAERNWSRGLNPAGVGRQLVAIFASGSRRERLPGVAAPTLVIHGARDPLVPIGHGEIVHQLVPAATMLRLDDMGHALSRPHWDTVIDAITAHAGR